MLLCEVIVFCKISQWLAPIPPFPYLCVKRKSGLSCVWELFILPQLFILPRTQNKLFFNNCHLHRLIPHHDFLGKVYLWNNHVYKSLGISSNKALLVSNSLCHRQKCQATSKLKSVFSVFNYLICGEVLNKQFFKGRIRWKKKCPSRLLTVYCSCKTFIKFQSCFWPLRRMYFYLTKAIAVSIHQELNASNQSRIECLGFCLSLCFSFPCIFLSDGRALKLGEIISGDLDLTTTIIVNVVAGLNPKGSQWHAANFTLR